MSSKPNRPTVQSNVQIKDLIEGARGASQIVIPISNGQMLVIPDYKVDYVPEGGKKYVFTSKTDQVVRVTFVYVSKPGRTSSWELTRHDGVPFSKGLAIV